MGQSQIDEEALAEAYVERLKAAARAPVTLSESIKKASDQRRDKVVATVQGIAKEIDTLPATSKLLVKEKLGAKTGVGKNIEFILKESSAVAMVGLGEYWAIFFGKVGA